MSTDGIVVRGAREHNLKGVDVTIPHGRFTVVTGVSGSGKSSLAFDTICKEGQRRFLESLSAYARQFLGGYEKPQVDHVEGLSPTVAIDQKTVGRNPRSTVGTITEIHDHLRLLYARLGTPHCPACGREVREESVDSITERLLRTAEGRRVVILAPLVRDRRGAYRKELAELRRRGFVRARIDGEIRRLDEVERLDRYRRHTLELIVDRLRPTPDKRPRLAEAVETAVREGGDVVMALIEDEPVTFSRRRACVDCSRDLPELEPRLFSFNSPHGACARCSGLGVIRGVDETLLVPDPGLSLADGALANLVPSGWLTYCRMKLPNLGAICRACDIPFDRPWSELTRAQRDLVLRGTGDRTFDIHYTWEGKNFKFRKEEKRTFAGVATLIEEAYRENGSRHLEKKYLSEVTCPACGGTRLKPEARAVRFRDRAIDELSRTTVSELRMFFEGLTLDERESTIGRDLFPELVRRLGFLESVGLDYLSLDRTTTTLAGGETQRIHLASQLGAGLRGVLYVLDEPSIGLHPRDHGRLLGALARLRDLGNTVIVVEHDEETMRAADHIVDLGPGPGRHGGELVAEGTAARIARVPASITGQFLSGRRTIPRPEARRPVNPDRRLVVRGAAEHNLKDVDVAFPLGCLTAVTGVSGSGKSTLVDSILKRALARKLHRASRPPGRHQGLEGVEHLDKVIEIDQTPIGRTPRSNPATYTKLFGAVRQLFAATPEARARGWGPGRFSFNVKGGRCESCKGAGVTAIEMQFLADVEVTCDDCLGRRFNAETRTVTYQGLSVDQVLELTVEEALARFQDVPPVARPLAVLQEVGLGYLTLGQSTTTLSGGEAQRIKLATELSRPSPGRTLYLLDEPTTGLHHHDVERLVHALQRLVDAGHSVVVIEHNLDVVQAADWLIDLGPEGGEGGGRIVAEGPPELVADHPASHTGAALRAFLGRGAPTGSSRARRAARGRAPEPIRIRGARQHNLRNVDVDLPAGRMTVITGVSGSGKTSLAFDTLFHEGQRRFVESLSTYARRFLGRLDRAPVDSIEGLGPAIAIDQRTATRNPRSTVATVTEIHDYLRLLFARLGRPHSPTSGRPLRAWTPTALARHLVRRHEGRRAQVLAPILLPSLDDPTTLASSEARARLRRECQQAGFVRVAVGRTVVDIRRDAVPAPAAGEPVFVVVDRVRISARVQARLAEAVETAYAQARDRCGVEVEGRGVSLHAAVPACLEDGVIFTETLSPRHFSFNSHVGACTACGGLGVTWQVDPERLVADPGRPLLRGGLHETVVRHLNRDAGISSAALEAAIEWAGGDPGQTWQDLDASVKQVVLHGAGENKVRVTRQWKQSGRQSELVWDTAWRGLMPLLEQAARRQEERDDHRWGLETVLVRARCADCEGTRLQPVPRHVRVAGRRIAEVLAWTVDRAHGFFSRWKPAAARRAVADPIVQEVLHRLDFLKRVGLGYLTLDRASATLSGGEAQRIRLATQIGNRLTGVNYVLDEPTIGLHPRDTERLIATLHELRDLGNTLVVVEHDEAVIRAADHVVELGPGAGKQGGSVVAAGTWRALARNSVSPTGRWLKASGSERDRDPGRAAGSRRVPARWLTLAGASKHNLKDLTVRFPRAALTVVTGVSGSGKSTLVLEELGVRWRTCPGAEDLKRVVVVDAAAIGTTPASNPATYSGVFTPIRELFATLPESQLRGFRPARFSFNHGDGRCETCGGRGAVKVEMHFLSDVWIPCQGCGGRRYNEATLAVRFKGRSIADVLATEVGEAQEIFRDFPRIRRPLERLVDVGLGYLTLGQPANTLSGGEAQRVKLASELARPGGADTLYLLDEPTIGLHGQDVALLLRVLTGLVDKGGTAVVIEHHPDVMRAADWVIDLGPEGGDEGGRVVVAGSPEEVARHAGSHTARFL